MSPSNIVGYQQIEVPYGYAIFTATFKDVENQGIDLNTLKPTTPAGVTITGDGKVTVFVLDEEGNYGTSLVWYGSKGYWSKDNGASKIADKDVVIINGKGLALNNTLKTVNGVESTGRTAKASPAAFMVSGEVDSTCANAIPYGYSINGNSTPVAFDVRDIVPQTPALVDLTGDGKVTLFLLDEDGNYGTSIVWYGSKKYWSQDNGATQIAATPLNPGQGFAVNNTLKTVNGVESTGRTAKASPAILKIPSPIK